MRIKITERGVKNFVPNLDLFLSAKRKCLTDDKRVLYFLSKPKELKCRVWVDFVTT